MHMHAHMYKIGIVKCMSRYFFTNNLNEKMGCNTGIADSDYYRNMCFG